MHEWKGAKNINIINIRMSQKYVENCKFIRDEGGKGGEINVLKCRLPAIVIRRFERPFINLRHENLSF